MSRLGAMTRWGPCTNVTPRSRFGFVRAASQSSDGQDTGSLDPRRPVSIPTFPCDNQDLRSSVILGVLRRRPGEGIRCEPHRLREELGISRYTCSVLWPKISSKYPLTPYPAGPLAPLRRSAVSWVSVCSDALLNNAGQEATPYVCRVPDYARQLSGGEMTSLRSACHPPDISNIGT